MKKLSGVEDQIDYTTSSCFNLEEWYVIHTDASIDGLSCVLMQNSRVVGCGSRKLKPHEDNYPNHDLVFAVSV